MPVSHIGLTVSHLPTSCSFFLAALQPLGYRYIGKYGNQIGLGVVEADFFLTQETPGIKAGAAHVAFSASSRAAVRNFYANALEAGGSPHGSPAAREDGEDIFNAAVFDCDGNSVEVVFHEDAAFDDGASYSGQSRVLTLRQGDDNKLSDNKSTVSMKSAATSPAKKALMPASSVASRSNRAPSVANSAASKATSRTMEAPAVKRSFTAPTLTPKSSDDTIQISRKTLVGTIIGAAAGAAVAYAMCKSEEDSARVERGFYQATQQISQQIPRPKAVAASESQPVYASPPRSVQNASEVESYYGGQYMQPRAIEPPPPSGYQHPSYTTVFTGQQPDKASTASRSRVSFSRSMTMPEERQQTQNRAQSTLISSFAPSEPMREPSEHRSSPSNSPRERRSSHSSKSQASEHKSSTSTSKQSSSSSNSRKHRSKSRRGSSASRSQSPVFEHSPEPRREAPSSRSSVLGRSVVEFGAESPYQSSSEQDTGNDTDTVVPSDSISCVGSSRRSSHRSPSHLSQQQSVHSSPPQQQSPHQFSARIPSSSSTHSKRDDSRRASEAASLPPPSPPSSSHLSRAKSKRASSDVTGKKKLSHKERRDSKDVKVVRPDFIEEADSEGDEDGQSTMTPGKYSKYGGGAMGRSGSEAQTLPIRGITQSMVDGHSGGHVKRGVASYAG